MNRKRRKAIMACINALRSADIDIDLEEIETNLSELLYEEDEYRDNMPENLQESTRFYDSEAASDSLNDAIVHIQDAISYEDEPIRRNSIEQAIFVLEGI